MSTLEDEACEVSSTQPQPATTFHRFTSLPIELQAHIYHYVLLNATTRPSRVRSVILGWQNNVRLLAPNLHASYLTRSLTLLAWHYELSRCIPQWSVHQEVLPKTREVVKLLRSTGNLESIVEMQQRLERSVDSDQITTV